MYRLLDLFSGIGGFSLGLERSGGFKTVAFCEVEPFCQKILTKHWPEVPIYGDVRELNADRLAADGIRIDAICGGFPCQDISTAGKGAGIEGERSSLWSEYARLIGELRPRYVFVENVAALLSRGLDRVLGDLAARGYDCEWHCIPASAVGLPHARARIWIIAYRDSVRKLQPGWRISNKRRRYSNRREAIDWALSSGGVLRSDDGVPAGLDRIRTLGNAVVPQIPEMLGRAVLDAERAAA